MQSHIYQSQKYPDIKYHYYFRNDFIDKMMVVNAFRRTTSGVEINLSITREFRVLYDYLDDEERDFNDLPSFFKDGETVKDVYFQEMDAQVERELFNREINALEEWFTGTV